ncbi:MAG TPA: EamA family transporter [Burkholderiales bacterium]|nr:EamA family transporter [Burkholderiales bacterium]
MIHGIAFALGAMIFYGLGDLVYKRAAQAGVRADHFLMVQSWCFVVCVTLYGLATGTLRFEPPALWGAAAGLCAYTGFYNFARSLQSGSVSVHATIFRMSFTLTAALAVVLLDEPLTPYKLLGLALALAAGWLLLGSSGGERAATPHVTRASLARVAVATIAVAIAYLIYKIGLRAGATPASLLTVQAMVVVSLSTGLVGVVDRRIRPARRMLHHAATAAVVLAVAFILLLEGLARGPASVLVPIAQMGFVVTAAAGFVFLKEPFTPRIGLGLGLAVAALASLAASLP